MNADIVVSVLSLHVSSFSARQVCEVEWLLASAVLQLVTRNVAVAWFRSNTQSSSVYVAFLIMHKTVRLIVL
jgi:hypothetical protein